MAKDGPQVSAPPQAGAAAPQDGGAGAPWIIYRVKAGVFRFARAGTTHAGRNMGGATSAEAARRACRQLARDERHGTGPFDGRRPTPVAAARARATASSDARAPRIRAPLGDTYPCGHPRTEENSYVSGRGALCKECHRKRALARYHNNASVRRRQRELGRERARRTRRKPTLAWFLYQQLRKLAIRDGLWLEPRSREELRRA